MLSGLANRAWLATQKGSHRRYTHALLDPAGAQRSQLAEYLRLNAASKFGRRHRFSDIRSAEAFSEKVPSSRYDDYAEAVAQIRAGESEVLTTSRVRLLEPTSGSTSAAKLIPYTRRLQSEFRGAIGPWLTDLSERWPSVCGGPSYWSISPADPETPPSGAVAIGFDSDRAYLGGALAWLTGFMLVDCDDLRRVRDPERFRRLTLLRLLSARHLTLISVWHPTWLHILLDQIQSSWVELLDALATGIAADHSTRGIRAAPARARELARADPEDLAAIWPSLTLVSCWGDGQAAESANALSRRLGNVAVQHKGLLSTEACISIPFRGQHPLALRSHFFEFEDSRGNMRFAWQLQEGEQYAVVVTTGGGLYRYRTDDRIVVDGFVEQAPSIRFIGRLGQVSDLRGEKLSDAFVASILNTVLRDCSATFEFSMLAPNDAPEGAGYTLFVETSAAHGAELPERLARTVESALRENPHYANCIRLGQLRPVQIEITGPGAANAYLERQRAGGAHLGSIKPVALSTQSGWKACFGTTPPTGN